jgi:hypothetical protein
MDTRKMFLSIAEALMIYGLIAFSYGILVIHVAQTWSGDWPVDRNLSLSLVKFLSSLFSTSLGFGSISFMYLTSREVV